MYEVSGSVSALGEGVPVAAGLVQSSPLCGISSHQDVVPPDLDDPWLGDPWAEVSWERDDLPAVDHCVGPALVVALNEADLAALSAGALVDVVAAWERVASWVRASQARAVAELTRRAEMTPLPSARGIGSLTPISVTAAEVAATLPLTRRQAENLVGESVQLVEDFPATVEALESGRLDVRRARVIVDELGSLEPEVRRTVETEIVTAMPMDAAGGADSTVLRRRLKRAVHELAPVTVEQRRARARRERFVRVTPTRDGMAWLEALLPAEDAIAIKTTLDAAAREFKRRDSVAGDSRARTMDQRRADALAELAWSSLSAGRVGGRQCECPSSPGVRLGSRRRPVSVQVTVPFASMIGMSAAPGELHGYGPIPAPVARKLAAAGIWQWLGHDPVTGALLSYGRTRYIPPAELAEFIIARDTECRMPGCHHPARGCELDHTIAFPEGETAAGNLGALCSFHHHLKHHTQWHVEQPQPGTFHWTSPAGRIHTVRPADLGAYRHHANAHPPEAVVPEAPIDRPLRPDHPPDEAPF